MKSLRNPKMLRSNLLINVSLDGLIIKILNCPSKMLTIKE